MFDDDDGESDYCYFDFIASVRQTFEAWDRKREVKRQNDEFVLQ